MVYPLGANPDPHQPEPRLTVQHGPVPRRADGSVGGWPIAPRRPRASRQPRRWRGRAGASPRIRRRRAVFPSGSLMGVRASQVALKSAGSGQFAPTGGTPGPLYSLCPWLSLRAITFLTFIAFQPVLANGFVHWDDEPNFFTNMHYRGLGPSRIAWALTTFHLGAYQPWVGSYSAEYCVCGLDPRGYHIISLILYIL